MKTNFYSPFSKYCEVHDLIALKKISHCNEHLSNRKLQNEVVINFSIYGIRCMLRLFVVLQFNTGCQQWVYWLRISLVTRM